MNRAFGIAFTSSKIDRLISFSALAVSLSAVALLVISVLSAKKIDATFRGNLNFYASQIDNELNQLVDYLDRFSLLEPEATKEDLILRFDILWSRVFNTGIHNSAGAKIDLPGAEETILKLQKTLADIEDEIQILEPDEVDVVTSIKRRLRNILPLTKELTLSSKNDDASRRAQYLERQIAQTYYVIGFIFLTLVLFAFGAVRLKSNQIQIRKMNHELESKIQARTLELEQTNEQLVSKIDEVEKSQSLLEESSERLSQAARLAKLGYYIWDSIEDKCEFCSEQHAISHGCTPIEYIDDASSLSGEMSLIHPDDREMVRSKYKSLRGGKIIDMEYWVITPGGRRRLREVARPILNEKGKVLKEIGSTIDITDQRETELKLLEAQRMDHIGKLSGGVAHDFNNLLAVIMGNAELLRITLSESERQEMVEDIYQATLRGRDLTRSMLTYARRAPLSPKTLEINNVVNGIEGFLRRSLPKYISFETSLTASPWKILADQSLLESAILNLTLNARDSMPNGGNLTIETSNLVVDENDLATRAERIDYGRYVMLAVTDTGTGIDPKDIDKIFDPFYTTKGPATNSGLGLSMVQGFFKQSGGTVRVYSEPGVGTTFKLFFPVTKILAEYPEHRIAAHNRNILDLLDFNPRVLLVEDDEIVRKTIERNLVAQGLNVVSASDSATAEIAFRTKGDFDILVTDIVMPGDLQGPALAKKLRSLQSDLPVIFLSGYPQEATVHGNGLQPEDIRLMKPISSNDLVHAVTKALNDSNSRID